MLESSKFYHSKNSVHLGINKTAFDLVKGTLALNYNLPADLVLAGGLQLNYFVDRDIRAVMDYESLAIELKVSKIFKKK